MAAALVRVAVPALMPGWQALALVAHGPGWPVVAVLVGWPAVAVPVGWPVVAVPVVLAPAWVPAVHAPVAPAVHALACADCPDHLTT